MEAMGNRFAEVFAEAGITKVITIEASESLLPYTQRKN